MHGNDIVTVRDQSETCRLIEAMAGDVQILEAARCVQPLEQVEVEIITGDCPRDG